MSFVRGAETFASKSDSSQHKPIIIVGAHVRTYYTPQSLVLTGSAQTLTVPSGATHADIYCEGASDTDVCRYWHGGGTPTISAGVKLKDHEIIESADPATFRAINMTGTCTLRVEYYSYQN